MGLRRADIWAAADEVDAQGKVVTIRTVLAMMGIVEFRGNFEAVGQVLREWILKKACPNGKIVLTDGLLEDLAALDKERQSFVPVRLYTSDRASR